MYNDLDLGVVHMPSFGKEGKSRNPIPATSVIDKPNERADFESPVEEVDLSAAPLRPKRRRSSSAEIPAQADPAAPRPKPKYGLHEITQLLRSLPETNPVIIQAVRQTLESTGIDLHEIIEAADRRHKAITTHREELAAKITDLESKIALHKEEIELLKEDEGHTSWVRDQLLAAEKQAFSDLFPAGSTTPTDESKDGK